MPTSAEMYLETIYAWGLEDGLNRKSNSFYEGNFYYEMGRKLGLKSAPRRINLIDILSSED